MRLSAIRLHWIRIPLHEPFRIANGEVSAKDSILIELESGGRAGWGEASPMPGSFYSAETPESTWDFLRRRLIPDFLARPQLDPCLASRELDQFAGEPFAKAGLEGALWDLKAQAEAKPLWELLGGCNRAVASGAAIGLMPSSAELLARVERFLREGYRRIKIKIEPGNDVELVRDIRQRLGGIPLMVDANASYDLARHAGLLQELDDFGLLMIEQPLAREAIEDHAQLQSRLQTPICLDESAESPDAVRDIIRRRAARILNIKVQRMGGLERARQAHDLAQSAGIPCWLGTMPELGVASAQGLHLATLPNFTLATDVEASLRWYVDDMISPRIEVSREGYIQFPAGPGMGYALDPRKLERYRLRVEEFRP